MADYYVSSSEGDDGNAGTSDAAPVRTLAQADSLTTAGDTVYLLRGDSWDEGFPDGVDYNVSAYGNGARPFLDGTDVQTGWSLVSMATFAYEKSVTLDETVSSGVVSRTPMVFEDGVLLTRVTSAAACESTSGSYYTAATDMSSSPVTMQIHPSDDGDPSSNGKEYRVTVRVCGIAATAASSASISNIEARGFGNDNGSLVAPDGTITNCKVTGGGKHHIFADAIIGCEVVDSQTEYSTGASTLLVAFQADPDGDTASITDATITLRDNEGSVSSISAAYIHDTGNPYSSLTCTRVAMSGDLQASLSGIVDAVANTDILSYGCRQPMSSNSATATHSVTRLRARLNDNSDGNANGDGSVCSASTLTSLRNANFYGTYSSAVAWAVIRYTDDISLTNVTFRIAGNGGRKIIERTSGVLTCNYCVFFGRPGSQRQIEGAAGYTGDHNIFHARGDDDSNTDFDGKYDATTYTTLADWQAASGQDANSVYLTTAQAANFWLNDPATGDWRINPNAQVTGGDGTVYKGTFPDGVPITQAGAQPPLPITWDHVWWYSPHRRRSIIQPIVRRPVQPTLQ